MIEDLVVNLGVGKPPDAAADYTIAAAFDAHLAAVGFAFEPVAPPSPMGGIPAEPIDAQCVATESTADKAIPR